MTSPNLPGRLGTPGMELRDDPRADPRMLAMMGPLGTDVSAPSPVDGSTSIEDLLAYCDEAELGFEMMNDVLFADTGSPDGVVSTTEVITGMDGNDITLYIHRPADAEGPLPGLVHFHGGGMVFLTADGPGYRRWREDLAASGLVVVGVEFRNGGGKLGPYPFPAGLNDCTSAIQWTAENREALGISKIVLSGESGGGNLTLATAIRAKREGHLDLIAGAYALCPYISGAYADRDPALASLYENDEYFIGCDMLGALVKVYDPRGEQATNPLAWPYHASLDDLEGLPPHVISVNQLDPLRDEGLAYFRKLLDAGVSARSRTVNGTCHAGDMLCLSAMPEVYAATVSDIKNFADSL